MFSDTNAAISPVDCPERPIEVFVFVQLKIVPGTGPVNTTGSVSIPAHNI